MSKRLVDTVWEEFNVLMAVGNIYPFIHTTGWKIFTAVNYLVANFFLVLGMILLMYTCLLVRDNISYLSQALHMLIVGAVAMGASLPITFSRKHAEGFEELICVPESFAPYTESEYFRELRKEGARKKRNNIVLWILMYGSCGAVGLAQRVIDSISGRTTAMVNVNGVWMNLPIVVWSPFDLENNTTMWLITYAFLVCYMIVAAMQVVSAVVICLFVADKIQEQLKLQLWAIENLDARANEMFRSRYPTQRMKDMLEEYDECYYDCIVQNVKHHLRAKIEFDKFLNIAKIAIAVPFYGGAVLLGMALITITADDDVRLGPKCLAFMLATAEGLNMFNLCRVGQDFNELSIKIFQRLFYTRWYRRSAKCSRAIIIMRYGCSRPLKLEVALLTLDMGFFADLVNSAYSIFNLKAVSEQ